MRTYRYISADSHIHNNPERWAQRVPERYRERLPQRVPLPGGREGLMDEEGHVSSGGTGHFCTLGPEGFDPTAMHYEEEAGYGPPEQRLGEMEADGLDAEILFSFTGSVFGPGVRKDKDYAVAVYHAYNAYLAEEFCSVARDRLLGIGLLPNKGADEDVAEMEHCARLGLRGVMVQTYPSGHAYPTPEDDRFWAAALDLDVPVTIHTAMMHRGNVRGEFLIKYPTEPEGYERPPVDFVHLMSRYMHHHCGGLELTQMIVTGLFDRFPKLKIYWAENNIAWVPPFLEQMDMTYEANRFWAERILGVKPLARRPSEYAREHAYWGFFDDPFGVRAARYDVGIDHILWGSDFPHEVSRWPHSIEYMQQQMAGVPEEEERKMMCESTIKFFHLDR